MEAIQNYIQPKFKLIGDDVTTYLSNALELDMFLHIAKHARRSVNPPKDTWLAVAANKRGYKKHPHFQIGLFDDHVFVWFALIYELPMKTEIAKKLLDHYQDLKALPANFVISLDHTKKDAFPISDLQTEHLERFRDVKKAEFLIGRHFQKTDPIIQDGKAFITEVKKTFDTMIPLYQISTD
ncbi:DUF1054 domain-containing protein [Aquibacillus sp. 3ASR75-11]|uniref:DUF1054 domain-containing protein n=2 Tax=Terrihalobacillus insolitus TaxID=2950438 RepID=A0A9X3WQ38_9BACI|nr:DUF1054 domain-containing protein [Terrihalobacillus insolitus]MDC3423740.1 DUF1054 domain-containing protein [Terrihalobacillus insolitus]